MASSAHAIAVGLSTASVYPQTTEAAFDYAAELGYDGVELMIWSDPISQDVGRIARLARSRGIPVLSIHSPCLLISQRVWGRDPVAKLARSARTAIDLGADTVVVHPPFRWQRRYSEYFAEIVAEVESDTGVAVAVENMFPMRADRLLGERSAQRLLARGGGPGAAVSAYGTSIDPTDDGGFANYTLDLSHTATAGVDALAMFDRMGANLRHLHLADGSGRATDEHLIPGDGTQPCGQVCGNLAAQGFNGAVILEVSTSAARSSRQRSSMLSRALDFARANLRVPTG